MLITPQGRIEATQGCDLLSAETECRDEGGLPDKWAALSYLELGLSVASWRERLIKSWEAQPPMFGGIVSK